ncbi:hypothetical protein TUMEXPCC7403_09085 [Tumidithrix helvetica PCC 7403]
MVAQPQYSDRLMSPKDYLDWDAQQDIKYEYELGVPSIFPVRKISTSLWKFLKRQVNRIRWIYLYLKTSLKLHKSL